ncbi:MAG: GTPase [Hormoscilla sp.]
METYDDLIETIIESYQKAQAEIGQCNILIIGKTGVGKSTLINAVFREPLAETGEGYPVTQDIRQYRKKGFPLTVYDTPGLELDAKQLQRVTKDVAELIESKKRENVKEQVHVVWYCINHNANRLEEIEKEWLKSLDLEVPIILILTQTLTRKRSEFTAWSEGQNLPVRQIIPVLARPKEIDDEHIIQEYGLDQIVQTTFDLLPEVAQKAFVNATKDINLKARRSFNYVTSYATAAAATGATPIPFSDARYANFSYGTAGDADTYYHNLWIAL